MIEGFVSEFVFSITSGIIMITIVDLVLPETDIKKYIIKVCGLILIILIFSPIVSLVNNSDGFDFDQIELDQHKKITKTSEFYSSYYFDEYYEEHKNNN